MAHLSGLLSTLPSILWVVGAALVGLIAAFLRGRSYEAQRQQTKRIETEKKALDERLEMDREATAIERKATGMTDAAAREEAMKWSRHR